MNSVALLAVVGLGDEAIEEPDPVAAGVLVDRARRLLEGRGAPASTVAAMIHTVADARRDAGRPVAVVADGGAEVEHLCGCGRRFFWPAIDRRPRCPGCNGRLNDQRHLEL